MFFILSQVGNRLRVLDIDDLVIEYIRIPDVIKALRRGIKFENVHDNSVFLDYLETTKNPKLK